MGVALNLKQIKDTLPQHVTLVAVSKTHPIEMLKEAYRAGQRIFGENKVQEMLEKADQMPPDAKWHMIGHLQTNKIKYIVPFVTLIHGVDSFKLLQAINNEAVKVNRRIDCLLQVHIAREDTKFGFSATELSSILTEQALGELTHVRIRGLMGMATFTDDEAVIGLEFESLKLTFDQLKASVFRQSDCFDTLSMGMSDDYLIAVEKGSTMVRVGSSIFGHRDYSAAP